MKTNITSAILEATSIEAMALALVEGDLRSGFSDGHEI